MDAVVVYESLWGNTAAVARAIAEGLGEGAAALSTGEAGPARIGSARLVVAGAPVHALNLPTDRSRESSRTKPQGEGGLAPDLSHPSMRAWLETVPRGPRLAASFETKVRGPLGHGAAAAIARALAADGLTLIAPPEGFVVHMRTSSSARAALLAEGELERAREWGAELARLAARDAL